MRAILIGSAAYKDTYTDLDILGDQEFLDSIPETPTEVVDGRWGKTTVFKDFRGTILEVTIPNPDTAWAYVLEICGEHYGTRKTVHELDVLAAPLLVLAALKKAHLIHSHGFEKHIVSYGELKQLLGVKVFSPRAYGELIHSLFKKHREEIRSITKKTPKLMGVTKQEFFGDAPYEVFWHDQIHESLSHPKVPAYTLMKDGEVECSYELWKALPEEEKFRCVVEEASVLALERSVIPALFLGRAYRGQAWAFQMALQKMSTGIVGNWMADYTIERYQDAIAANFDYVTRFFDGVKSGIVTAKQPEVVNGNFQST